MGKAYYRPPDAKPWAPNPDRLPVSKGWLRDWLLNYGKGGCMRCGVEITYQSSRLDHDHRCCRLGSMCMKCVRGLVCSACNAGPLCQAALDDGYRPDSLTGLYLEKRKHWILAFLASVADLAA